MAEEAHVRTGRCHCGEVSFEATLSEGFRSVRRCNCSHCRMRGAVAVTVPLGAMRIMRGEQTLARYRFNTGTAEHFFCRRCGIYTHHQRRSNPNEYGVNVACLEGVSPFDFAQVPVTDGIHHTKDTGEPSRLAGTLIFVPAGADGP